MNRLISQRLAAQSQTRQVEASVRADAAAEAVDRVFAAHWRSLLRSLDTRSIHVAQQEAQRHLAGALPLAISTIRRLLGDAAHWSFRTSRRHAETTLPAAYLRAGAERRLGLVESEVSKGGQKKSKGGQKKYIFDTSVWHGSSLLEAPAILAPSVSDTGGPPPAPGSIEMALHGLGVPLQPAKFGFTIEPVYKPLTDRAKRTAFLDLLFPPPSQSVIDSILYATVQGKTWTDRLVGATRTSATPQQLAQTVGQGIAQGKTVAEIAKTLLPVVDGVRSTARRIARTEALRVVQEASFQSWQGMGDLVIGYQIHATLDQVTRPDHAKRNGTIYYKEPRSGQHGLEECPHPPLEADGSIAWNCRCGLSTVLAPLPHLQGEAGETFRTAAGKAIGDPHTYDQWFSNANERHRKEAVGARRYNAVAELTGGEPEWAAFVDPEEGGLLPLDVLKAESPGQRASRIQSVRAVMAERRDLLGRVLRLQAV